MRVKPMVVSKPSEDEFKYDHIHEIVACVAECARDSASRLLGLVAFFLLPISTIIFLLPFATSVEGLPSWMIAFGVNSIFAYECVFLITFGVRLDTTLFELGVRLWKQGLLPSNFFETVSAWTCSSGFLLRRIYWADTVQQHGLGSLSRITLSVPLLGGNGDEMEVDDEEPVAESSKGSARSRDRSKQSDLDLPACLEDGVVTSSKFAYRSRLSSVMEGACWIHPPGVHFLCSMIAPSDQPKKKRKRTATSGRKVTTSKRIPSEDDRLSESDGVSMKTVVRTRAYVATCLL
ncbi:hypothetical protein B0H14DRAFT_2572430 [Mycena olivaceomarginata]|nr:hypothetical protein B0H14DRAFT_2572430 [Mycena olivaceomarginata]